MTGNNQYGGSIKDVNTSKPKTLNQHTVLIKDINKRY